VRQAITIIALLLAIPLILSSAFGHGWCWTCDQHNTVGWQLMSPEERKDHQARLAGFTSYSACKEYSSRHQKKIEERAATEGVVLPVMRENPCDAMRTKGVFK